MSDDKKLKHLEFIQNVITRMNSNSFMIKGWAVTLVAALFALSAKEANVNFYLIAFIPIVAFWILDGFFIATERRFVKLYKEVASKVETSIDFNMNPYFDIKLKEINANDKWYTLLLKSILNLLKLNCFKIFGWIIGVFSMTLIPFYGVLLLIMYFIKTYLNG